MTCSAWPRTPEAPADTASLKRDRRSRALIHSIPSAIPLVDVKAQYEPLLPAIRAAIDEVSNRRASSSGRRPRLRGGGPGLPGIGRHRSRERHRRDPARAGRDGIGPGDEVICPRSRSTRPGARAAARATPSRGHRSSDAEFDPADVAAPGDRPNEGDPRRPYLRPPGAALRASGWIQVIEDAAQAFGATVEGRRAGSVGIAGTFSFFPTKTCSASGRGHRLDERREPRRDDPDAALPRSRDKQRFELVVQLATGRDPGSRSPRLLPELDRWNLLRRDAASHYRELGLHELCELPEDEPGHVYHMYVVRTPSATASSTPFATPRSARPPITPPPPPPAGPRPPRVRAGLAPGDRARGRRRCRLAALGRYRG